MLCTGLQRQILSHRGGDGYWEFQNAIEYIDSGVIIVDAVENFLDGRANYVPKYEGRVLIK